MLREVVASRAAKLIAACVCPVAGAGTLTVTVPEVRERVHRATAPRAIARPQVRPARARPVVQPALAAVECPPDLPIVLASNAFTPPIAGIPPGALPAIPGASPPFAPGVFAPVTPIGFVAVPPPGPGGPGSNPGPGPGPDPVPVIPEPATWLQMIVGFGIIGGAMRVVWRRRHEYELVDDAA